MATHVAINILGCDQHDVAGVFAKSGGDKFSQIDWQPGIEGVPLLAGAVARFQTVVSKTTKVGTHTVFFCTVVEAEAEAEEQEPLLYVKGSFIDGRKLNE